MVIVLLIVLLFGAKKIPELMRGAGRGVKEFKDAMNKDYPAEGDQETENGASKPADRNKKGADAEK